MKHLVILLMVAILPLCANAQSSGIFGKKSTTTKVTDFTPYMQGAVPVENGMVTFSKTLSAPGKSKEDLYRKVASWASARYMPSVENGKWTDPDYFRNLEYATVKSADEAKGQIVCQGCEELVFSNKFLERDYTDAEYKLTVQVSDGSVKAVMSNIVYAYTFAEAKERKTAEQYITDDMAFTKKGKFIKQNRKFRVKTVDLANELFSEIETIIK
ncbi:MAG: DUF4468 domain-containing protein [Bacteroidaceae bacterium]|nr:DUF4468 domain-containing protein [Bacteroidaceae bacterium]